MLCNIVANLYGWNNFAGVYKTKILYIIFPFNNKWSAYILLFLLKSNSFIDIFGIWMGLLDTLTCHAYYKLFYVGLENSYENWETTSIHKIG